MDIALWKKNIKEAVKDIADKNFQEEVWLHETNIVSSPVEVYCTLFDDFSFPDFLEAKEAHLTKEQKVAGRKLIDALDRYSPPGKELPSPKQMVRDPEWHKVRAVAQDFLKIL